MNTAQADAARCSADLKTEQSSCVMSLLMSCAILAGERLLLLLLLLINSTSSIITSSLPIKVRNVSLYCNKTETRQAAHHELDSFNTIILVIIMSMSLQCNKFVSNRLT